MVRHLDIRTFWQRDGRCSSSQRRLTPGPGAGPNAGLASIYISRSRLWHLRNTPALSFWWWNATHRR